MPEKNEYNKSMKKKKNEESEMWENIKVKEMLREKMKNTNILREILKK
jgi:hypothetical protein